MLNFFAVPTNRGYFELCLLKYFVPSLAAFIDKNNPSNVEAFKHYLQPIVERVSQLPYFAASLEPLKLLFDAKFEISLKISKQSADKELSSLCRPYGRIESSRSKGYVG